MSRKAAVYVHVAGRVFAPGDVVPDEFAAKVTNPAVWAEAPAESSPETETRTGEPPRSGRGSGKDAWAEYAAARGVTVPEDASRDDIIAAVDAAGRDGE